MIFSSVQLISCVWLFATGRTACSMRGFPVLHQTLEIAQTHTHWVSDAIQPSYPLLSPSLPAFNLSQHQGLFQWVSSSPQVAKVLEFQLQHQSFQWIFRTDFLYDWLDGSPCSPKDSQESSPTLQFKSINSLFYFSTFMKMTNFALSCCPSFMFQDNFPWPIRLCHSYLLGWNLCINYAYEIYKMLTIVFIQNVLESFLFDICLSYCRACCRLCLLLNWKT